jgi:hypothetical protein
MYKVYGCICTKPVGVGSGISAGDILNIQATRITKYIFNSIYTVVSHLKFYNNFYFFFGEHSL